MDITEIEMFKKSLVNDLKEMGQNYSLNDFHYTRRLNEHLEDNDKTASLDDATNILKGFIEKEMNSIERTFRSTNTMRDPSTLVIHFLNKLSEHLNKDEKYSYIISKLDNLNPKEKELFSKVFEQDQGIIGQIYSHITGIGPQTFENKESFIKDTESVFFTKQVKELLNKKMLLNDQDSKFREFFNYLSDNILPALKTEQASKFYLYVVSGHLYNDYHNDDKLKKLMFEPESAKECIKYLQKKMTDHQLPLYLEDSNKNNPLATEYQYKQFRTEYNVTKTTPSGYVDCVMRDSENPNLLYFLNATRNKPESDSFNHLNDLIKERTAREKLCKRHGFRSISIDVIDGHDLDWVRSTAMNPEFKNNNPKAFQTKEILDTLLPRLAYFADNAGENKDIIILGDTKYAQKILDKKHPYEVFSDFIKLINDGVINLDSRNDSVVNALEKSIELYKKSIKVDTELKDHQLLHADGSSTQLLKTISENLKLLTSKVEFNLDLQTKIEKVIKEIRPANLEKLYIEASFNNIRADIRREKAEYLSAKVQDFQTFDNLIKKSEFIEDLKEITFRLGTNLRKMEVRQRETAVVTKNINEDYKEIIYRQENATNDMERVSTYHPSANLPGHKIDENKKYQKVLKGLYDIIIGANTQKLEQKFFVDILSDLQTRFYEKEIFKDVIKDKYERAKSTFHNSPLNKPFIIKKINDLINKHILENTSEINSSMTKFDEYKANDSILKKDEIIKKYEAMNLERDLSMKDITDLQKELDSVQPPKVKKVNSLKMKP